MVVDILFDSNKIEDPIRKIKRIAVEIIMKEKYIKKLLNTMNISINLYLIIAYVKKPTVIIEDECANPKNGRMPVISGKIINIVAAKKTKKKNPENVYLNCNFSKASSVFQYFLKAIANAVIM